MNSNMFIYYASQHKIPIQRVDGWGEKDLITTLGTPDVESRKFYIQVYDENPILDGKKQEEVLIDVEVDIHFFESLMKAIKQSGYMSIGIRKTFYNHTTAKLNKNQVMKVLGFLGEHNKKSEIKFPRNTIKLFLSALYNSPKYFYLIDEFEKKHPNVVEIVNNKKIDHRKKRLDEEYSEYVENITRKYEEKEEKLTMIYEGRIDRAWMDNDDANVDILEDLLKQEIRKINDELADRILKYNDNYLKKMDNVEKYSYPTYAFKLYDFDCLLVISALTTFASPIKFATNLFFG